VIGEPEVVGNSNEWRRFRKSRTATIGFAILLVLLFLAIAAPWIAPNDPFHQDSAERLSPPRAKHLLGTDHLGRDILSRLIYGTRYSFVVGIVSVAIGLCVGSLMGFVAGFYGRWLDGVLTRCMDVLLAFPGILLALAVVAALGPGLVNVMIAVGVWSVPIYGRIARGAALALKHQEFVQAVRALGANNLRVLAQHILPNSVPPLLVLSSLHVASAILWAAALSFLGLGAQPPTPEWGAMLNDGRQYIQVAPHVATFPGLAIMITVLSFNFLGDGLRDALDPRLR
jgi:peptide/nickel transport system permease protein